MAAVAGASTLIYAPRQLHAEEPPLDSPLNRKPIYDDAPLDQTAPAPPTPVPTTPRDSLSPSPTTPYRPTPTDRLAVQIGHARLFLYQQSTTAESLLNSALTSALRLEHSFTSTVRSLAPPASSSEKVVPGALYVLVATLAGSIVTRNRTILLRASVPAALGIGAAYAVLPLTMRNVGELAWAYEERYPAVAEAHLVVRERVQRFLETGKAHSALTVGMVQDKVGETRERLEDWVKKGK
ncbi:mitochondrial protein-like protein [Lophiostoma macrostomum CBS 122681]|uniref:MICOS complex subunit n=1 Tax=Lophiostoma macrostomum CBS 122681 TaxID=1314788 RepID=A0A6A6TN21_9PLEO|nr:mitochondrial protein-like protein [Lophiostoma macrostomum CBS 122681]